MVFYWCLNGFAGQGIGGVAPILSFLGQSKGIGRDGGGL